MGRFSCLRIVQDKKGLPGIKVVILSILLIFLFSPSIYSSPHNNTLIFLSSVDMITFDPGMVTDRYSSQIITNIFEGLTRYKKDSPDVEPCLAESWAIGDNGKRWVFRIRKGVKFHNGEILNASAVVKSFNTKLSDKKKYKEWNSFYTYLKTVRKVDDHIVEFILSKPYSPFLFQLASPKSTIIAPSSYITGRFIPSGTGPFRFGDRKEGKFVKIIRNDLYWDKSASLSNVIFKVVKDQKWRILQMRNDKADVTLLESMVGYNEIENQSKLKIISVHSAAISYLAFNTRKGPFRDKRMRRAIAHLIRKDAMVKKIFQKSAFNASSPVPPGMFGHNPKQRDYKFDVGEAKKLKIEAGYNSDVEVSLYYGANSKNLENIAAVLVRAAKKIGINIKRIPVSFSELLNIGYDKHDMLMMGWVGDIPDADVYLYPNFTEHSGSLNKSGYINPRLSNLIDKARMTSDKKVRKSLYFESQEILHNDLPWIPLYYPNELLLLNKNVKNLSIQPLSFLNFRDVFFDNKKVVEE